MRDEPVTSVAPPHAHSIRTLYRGVFRSKLPFYARKALGDFGQAAVRGLWLGFEANVERTGVEETRKERLRQRPAFARSAIENRDC